MADTAVPVVKLTSSDGEAFDVPRDVIKLSTTINTMLHVSVFRLLGESF